MPWFAFTYFSQPFWCLSALAHAACEGMAQRPQSKRSLCLSSLGGRCRYGDACKFAHSVARLRVPRFDEQAALFVSQSKPRNQRFLQDELYPSGQIEKQGVDVFIGQEYSAAQRQRVLRFLEKFDAFRPDCPLWGKFLYWYNLGYSLEGCLEADEEIQPHAELDAWAINRGETYRSSHQCKLWVHMCLDRPRT